MSVRVSVRDARLGEVRILGLAGSVAVSVAAAQAGALPVDQGPFIPTLLEVLGSAPPAALVLAYFGMALLVGAWLRLGSILGDQSVTPREMVVTLAWWAAPLLVGAPLYSRDIYSYLAQGSMVVNGIDPYQFGPAALGGDLAAQVSPVWQHTAAPYGPTFLLLAGAVMALAGSNIVLGILGMRLLALAAIAVFVWTVPIIARRYGVDPSRALWLGVLNPLVLAHVVSGAHNDALMVALVLVAGVLVLRDRPLAAAAVIGAATLVKAPAILALAFVVAAVWGPKPLRLAPMLALSARVGAAGFGTIAALTLVSGTGFGWVSAMGNTAEIHNGLSLSTDLGAVLSWTLGLLGLVPPVDLVTVTRYIGLACACAVTVAMLLRERRRPLFGLALSLTAFVVLGPVVNPWYLLWGLLPLAATTTDARIIRYATVASIGLALYPMPAGGAPGLSALIGILGLALAVLFLWWNPLSAFMSLSEQVGPVVGEDDSDHGRDGDEPEDDRDGVDADQGAHRR